MPTRIERCTGGGILDELAWRRAGRYCGFGRAERDWGFCIRVARSNPSARTLPRSAGSLPQQNPIHHHGGTQQSALLANAGDTSLAGSAALATSTAICSAGVGVHAVVSTALLRGQAGRGAGACLTHLTCDAGTETAATMPAVGVHVHTGPAANLEIGGPAAGGRAHAGNTTLGGLADHAAGAAVVRRGG